MPEPLQKNWSMGLRRIIYYSYQKAISKQRLTSTKWVIVFETNNLVIEVSDGKKKRIWAAARYEE